MRQRRPAPSGRGDEVHALVLRRNVGVQRHDAAGAGAAMRTAEGADGASEFKPKPPQRPQR